MADTGASAEPSNERGGSFLFLIGLVAFVGSALAFVADLLTGYDVLRSYLVNLIAALVLVGWAARDTLRDSGSAVDTPGGAASTALLLYGAYLVVTGVAVAATSLWHDRLRLALFAGGAGLVLVVAGFAGFPRGSVLGGDDQDEARGESDPDAGKQPRE